MSVWVHKTSSVVAMRLAAVLFAVLLLVPEPVEADPLRGGIIGGIGGLAIGGILGGGRGAAVGAIVGGVGGAMVGAAEQRRRQVRRPGARRPVARVAATPLISGIQGALLAKGFNPGSVDGRMGPATAQAISAYQQANGLLVTGQPSEALLNHMQAPPPAPAATPGSDTEGAAANVTTE